MMFWISFQDRVQQLFPEQITRRLAVLQAQILKLVFVLVIVQHQFQ